MRVLAFCSNWRAVVFPWLIHLDGLFNVVNFNFSAPLQAGTGLALARKIQTNER
jgi:hypothetical protein